MTVVRRCAGGVAAVMVLVSACRTEPAATTESTPAPATSASSVMTTSPTDAVKQVAVSTYLRMWRTYAEAATTSDWESTKLGEFATGAALSTMSRGLYADRYNGLVSRGQPTNNPVVVSAEPTVAPVKVAISDCGDSTNWRKYRADGTPAAGEPGGRRLINAVVEKQADTSWKVSNFGVREVGSC